MARKNDKTATDATPAKAKDDKAANKAVTTMKKGVKNPSEITLNRKSRGLTLSAIQKNINLERDIDGRHTDTSRKLYRQYREQGLLGPLAA